MNYCKKLTKRILQTSINSLPYALRGAHKKSRQCCQIRDRQIQECRSRVLKICTPFDAEGTCGKQHEMYTRAETDYPHQLAKVLRPGQECEIMRHDECLYKPSNKNRRYQRTWPECPYIWLRPKKVCCYDKEVIPPAPRRQRQPVTWKTITPQEKFWQHMNHLCKVSCPIDHVPTKKCIVVRHKTKCEKVKTPFPSFSECDQKGIRHRCDGECSCSLTPSKCEMWREFHRNDNLLKKCTEAIARKCAHRWHSLPLY